MHQLSISDLYQINSSGNRLLNAFTAPEQMWFRWWARHGIDYHLMAETALRLLLFIGLAAGGGMAFIWYLIPARLAFGPSYFIFFYALHRRGEEYGVYPLALPASVAKLLTLVLGPVVLQATLHRDVHHAQPRIAARHLAEMRAALSDHPE